MRVRRRDWCPGGICSNVPSGGLAAADVGSGLLCFLSQTCSTVGVLLANGLEVGQVLCAVHDEDKGTDFGAVGG